MINFILSSVGLFLLVFAMFYNRRGVSRLKTFSRKWWLALVFLLIGITLIQTAQDRKTMMDVRVKLHQLMEEIEAEKTVTYI